LEDRGKEELNKDLINKILLLNDLLTEADVEVIDNLACKLDQTDIDLFLF
jgi:hypothetical protein